MTLLMTTTVRVNHAYEDPDIGFSSLNSATKQQLEGNYAVFNSLSSDETCASLSTMVSNGWYISCNTAQ